MNLWKKLARVAGTAALLVGVFWVSTMSWAGGVRNPSLSASTIAIGDSLTTSLNDMQKHEGVAFWVQWSGADTIAVTPQVSLDGTNYHDWPHGTWPATVVATGTAPHLYTRALTILAADGSEDIFAPLTELRLRVKIKNSDLTSAISSPSVYLTAVGSARTAD